MAIFIGHISALEYWSDHDREPWHMLTQATPRPGDTPSSQDAAAAFLHHEIKTPIHAFVAHPGDRKQLEGVQFHVVQNIPRRSFVQIEKSIYLSTPEACFLQLAKHLPIEKLIIIGFELCGFYGIRRSYETNSPRNNTNMEFRKPRTSPQKLSTYLERAKTNHGAEKATRALRYILGMSASPMESALAAFLCLPTRYGGYGLPCPILNHEIRLSKRSQLKLPPNPSESLWADLCWPEKKLIIEYDSDLFHSGTEKINRDSRRRTLLELEGYHVISVTKKQLYGEIAFEEIARTVARRLEHRGRIRTKNFAEKQHALRKAALRTW